MKEIIEKLGIIDFTLDYDRRKLIKVYKDYIESKGHESFNTHEEIYLSELECIANDALILIARCAALKQHMEENIKDIS